MKTPQFRGIFEYEDEECKEWKNVVLKCGIPKFSSKLECEEFLKDYCARGSNPDYPNLKHVFSLLVDREQIEKILLKKLAFYDAKYPLRSPADLPSKNCFNSQSGLKIVEGIDRRMNLPFHRELNRVSTFNTLFYLFEHMRCGIFVMIRNEKVVMFVPFCNKDYVNNWGSNIKFDSKDGSFHEYYREKKDFYRRENIIRDRNKWWANGNIICNEHCRPGTPENETQYWGDQFLSQLRDMLDEACLKRQIPDCEFFINKRDYPHLKANRTEPYGFLFDRDDRNPEEDLELSRHRYETYAPIMSFYISNRFADLPFPCSEDWEAATGQVFLPSFNHSHCNKCNCGDPHDCKNRWKCYCNQPRHGVESGRDLFTCENFKKFDKKWEEKVNTAFFRGTATGGGTTIETNQRLHLAWISYHWNLMPEYQGDENTPKFLDACVTAWNMRDKKIAGQPMTYCKRSSFPFSAGKQHFIPIYDQSKYKYIIYVEGHCAANRYAFLMRLGSVILKVKSKCVADEMWYTPLLREMVDHVPVEADLSDLAEKIQWCRENDEKCKEIAQEARNLYERYISREATLDYIELLCTKIAKNYHKALIEPKVPVQIISKPHVEKNKSCDCKKCEELCEEPEQSTEVDEGEFSGKRRRRDSYDMNGRFKKEKLDQRNAKPEMKRCRTCRRLKDRCHCLKLKETEEPEALCS